MSRKEIRMSHEQKAPIHLVATVGSRTWHGSQITKAASSAAVIGTAAVHVGHIATYEADSRAA
ncbi:hypothetical protein WJ99_21280 [Burkholderia ubonensis]|nr:hypothetical protein WJ99_21280 [Burkholderia ubonensis]KVU31019.1 hypothetical protein WK65_02335 [Burkholderia ubonensis]KVU96611.1 hypothetical protein WK76_05560 [Burkholderia ubonensis]KWH22044.1 hypothetical protein WL97_07545 [Burkholderia ubonensis]OJA34445.1 hypothetical protein BGV47_22330 [Burkholderia ubonensis]